MECTHGTQSQTLECGHLRSVGRGLCALCPRDYSPHAAHPASPGVLPYPQLSPGSPRVQELLNPLHNCICCPAASSTPTSACVGSRVLSLERGHPQQFRSLLTSMSLNHTCLIGLSGSSRCSLFTGNVSHCLCSSVSLSEPWRVCVFSWLCLCRHLSGDASLPGLSGHSCTRVTAFVSAHLCVGSAVALVACLVFGVCFCA